MTRLNLYAAWIAVGFSMLCYWKADHSSHGAFFVEALDTIHERGLENMERQELFDAALRGMTREHDPYSNFITRNQRPRYLGQLDQHITGIGISLAHELDPETGAIVVHSTVIGSPHPAHDAGVRSGDRIVAVEGESIIGKSLQEAISRIKGPPDETVSITVVHEEETEPVTLVVRRADIAIDSVLGDVRKDDGTWEFRLACEPRIAYFRLTQFGDRTAEELTNAIASLTDGDGIEAAIVDIRDNSGGYLPASRDVCDAFIDEGTIVTTRDRDGNVEEEFVATAGTGNLGFPLVVLVNGGSASASEIFAACMQDHDRATILGSRTFGKGYVQQIIPMERDQSFLKLTTATYWRPSGKNIHRGKQARPDDEWGVYPNEGMAFEPRTKEQEETRRLQRRARDAFRPNRQADTDPIADDPELQKAVSHLQALLPDR